jgi:hypothetical protein
VSVVQSSRWWFSSSPAAPAVHLWFNPSGGCSPAVPAAPSLRPVVSSGPLMRRGCFHVPIHFYSFLSDRRFNASGPWALRTSFLRLGGGRTFQNAFPLISPTSISRSNKLVSTLVFLIILSDVLFIRRRSWSFRPRFLMPMLHSGLILCVFSSLLPLGAPLA